MRVIAGNARGVRLEAPRGMHTRPTADRVREALFSIILSRRDIKDARVLDICAGTGGLGIEALSRGAGSCCFIENNRQALTSLKRNLAAVRYAEQASVMEVEALKALRLLAGRASSFDLVFFDPPYASELYAMVPAMLSDLSLLAEEGLLVAECAARTIMPERIGGLMKIDRRVYGDTALEMFTWEGA
ncbi:16S rRNA (guanine(966)-N(2))-methyltransferase RsmD [Geobacter sp. SVR]|uniref:16S rRNA (guanine(966)-N(2))-methyltransferase RsmD n=1 Tax=Geobacter sp. SVR TaxID=2495594 RepID=UPI00156574CE|nr:16S rRNA (guanine(966)-N(2))-methyltransferase RsmD [Geobacter sp. SVR]